MDKALIKVLLKDKLAPKGDVKNDLKTALYVTACQESFDLDDRGSRGVLRYMLQDAGYSVKNKLDLEECRTILDELTAQGALTRFGSQYVRSVSLKSAQVSVRAKRVKNYSFSYDDDDDDFFVSFFVEDDKGEEYSLRTEQTVLPEDVVDVRLCPEKKIAFVQNIVKPRRCILGTVASARQPMLYTDDFALKPFKFVFSPQNLGSARPGNVVIAEIIKRSHNNIAVRTREVIKDLGKLNYIIVKAVLANNIPNAWPHNMQRALARIPDTVSSQDIKGRRDLRDLPLVTIDGEDARDFDDAVYAKKEGRGYRLYVAIADVSYYVRPGTVLDKEALARCNSVYFPNYVIPMLPEKLSNGICSLNPEVDRLCMVCEMQISSKGLLEKYEFYPAVMNSHARLTYTEAWQMIEHGTTSIPEHEAVIGQVKVLHQLYQVLAKARDARGGFAMESEEVHFVFNEKLRVIGMTPVIRNDAHKMIEECMIAANVAAASFIQGHKAQTLYRIHAKPTAEKLEQLNNALVRFGLKLPGGDSPSPQDYNAFCHAIERREDNKLLGQLLLRSMSKAQYSPDNIGHFGLALENYAHFTSPIRRYADLQLHRSIKFILDKQHKDQYGKIGARSYNKTELTVLGARCTEREIAADHAEYDVDNELKCILVKEYVGQITQGTVSAITSFGAFVHLDDFLVDGLLFIGNISSSYVNYNERLQTLSYDRVTLRVGDKLDVLIASVDVSTHKIDLLLPKEKQKGKLRTVKSGELMMDPGKSPDVAAQTKPIFDSIADLFAPSDAATDGKAEETEAKDKRADKAVAEKGLTLADIIAAGQRAGEGGSGSESAANLSANIQPDVDSIPDQKRNSFAADRSGTVEAAAEEGFESESAAPKDKKKRKGSKAKKAKHQAQESAGSNLDTVPVGIWEAPANSARTDGVEPDSKEAEIISFAADPRPLTLGDLIRQGAVRYDPALDPGAVEEKAEGKSRKGKGKKKKSKKKDKKNGK